MKPVVKVALVVVVLGFLLLGSAAFFVACTVNHLRIGGDGVHSGVEANRTETHELTLDASQPLRARVDCGSIRVGCGSSARVVARLRAFGNDKEDAEKRLSTMTLELGPNSVAGHEKQDHSLKFFEFGGGEQIDLELTLPAGTRLEIHSGSGDVSIQGAFGDTRAGSDYGDVAANGIRGALILKSSSGDIAADEIQGSNVRVETSYGDIELRQVRSDRIEAHSSSGEISISDANGACRAHSDYGDVAAAGVFSSLSLSSNSGSIHGRAQSGSTLAEGWELASDYGEVVLELPAGLAFALDASTDYGAVQADLPGVSDTSQDDETHKLRVLVGGGGPRLRLHSASGDISIRVR